MLPTISVKLFRELRDELMEVDDIKEMIEHNREDVVLSVIEQYIPSQSLEEMWDIPGLEIRLKADFDTDLPLSQWLKDDDKLYEEQLREKILQHIVDAYQSKEASVGEATLRHFEKAVMLQTLDTLWKEHLAAMDHLRQGIHLRGYAQKNPKQEYKRESFELFEDMLGNLKNDVITTLCKVRVQQPDEVERMEAQRQALAQELAKQQQEQHADADVALNQGNAAPIADANHFEGRKVGRNETCPCGSGKKFKQCHGKID